MEATIGIPEIAATNGHITFCNKFFAEIDTLDSRLTVGNRTFRHFKDNMVWSKEYLPSHRTGAFHILSKDRYHKFVLRIPKGVKWTNLTGFYADFRSAGTS